MPLVCMSGDDPLRSTKSDAKPRRALLETAPHCHSQNRTEHRRRRSHARQAQLEEGEVHGWHAWLLYIYTIWRLAKTTAQACAPCIPTQRHSVRSFVSNWIDTIELPLRECWSMKSREARHTRSVMWIRSVGCFSLASSARRQRRQAGRSSRTIPWRSQDHVAIR